MNRLAAGMSTTGSSGIERIVCPWHGFQDTMGAKRYYLRIKLQKRREVRGGHTSRAEAVLELRVDRRMCVSEFSAGWNGDPTLQRSSPDREWSSIAQCDV